MFAGRVITWTKTNAVSALQGLYGLFRAEHAFNLFNLCCTENVCVCVCLLQGVMQDVEILVMPQGYISQCPDLNRSESNLRHKWIVYLS